MNNFSGALKPTEAFIGHLWVVGALWWFYLQSQRVLAGNFMLLCQTEAQNERLPPSCLETIWSMRLSMAEGSGRGSTHVVKGYRSREEKERNTIHWGKITSSGIERIESDPHVGQTLSCIVKLETRWVCDVMAQRFQATIKTTKWTFENTDFFSWKPCGNSPSSFLVWAYFSTF